MKRFLSIALAAALLLSAIPAHAQTPPPKPIVAQIGATQQVSAANVEVGPNKIYLPLISKPQCYNLNPLTPSAANTQACVTVDAYAGSQSLAGYVTTVSNGAPLVFSTDMPAHTVAIPQQTIEIGPQSQTPVSSVRVRINQMAYMTETDGASAAGVDSSNPMPFRAMWVIRNALQNRGQSNPKLFPVSIISLHYSQPNGSANRTIPAAICGQTVGAYIYGYPVDVQFADATAASGNIWMEIEYPTCPGMKAFPWYRLNNFWQTLKTFPKYQDIDKDDGNGPQTYHAAVQMQAADGTITTVQAVVIVAVVGGIVLIAVFPPSGVGWWLLAGAAL
jgi:hypothetical protein